MYALYSWWVVARRLLHYFIYRLGLAGPCQPFDDIYAEGSLVIRHVFRWKKRMRILGAEHLPDPPVIFVANHVRFDDPIVMFVAIATATRDRYYARFMMRTGAFEAGSYLKSRLLDLDELATLVAAIQIDRDNVTLKQLKPFVKRLREGEAFAMYIGRTRSRTGMMFEYVEFDEPGSASFFMVQAGSGPDNRPIAAVPMVRTLNPVNHGSTFVFGEPLYLPGKPDRAAQRAFDFECVERIAGLVEVHVPHLAALAIYFRCLHGLPTAMTLDAFVTELESIRDALEHPIQAPELKGALGSGVRRTLRFFQKRGMVFREGTEITIASGAVLQVPALRESWRKHNIIKYLVNQVLHLQGVIGAAERVILHDAK